MKKILENTTENCEYLSTRDGQRCRQKSNKRLIAIFAGIAVFICLMSVVIPSCLWVRAHNTPENRTPLASECKLVVFSEDCFYPYSQKNVSISEQMTNFLNNNPGWYVKDIDCIYYPRNGALGSITLYVTFQKDY